MPINRITRSGNVATEPEVRAVGDSSVCHFRLGASRRFKGEWVTDWFTVNVWGKFGESIASRLRKGAKIVVSGSLEMREWEGKEGDKRLTPEIRCDGIEIMRQEDGEQASEASGPAGDDDDLPF